MAASATNMSNFNYFQNGKYGTLPQNSQKDMEVSQDMHLKMSKKIAQLTKVIYALNTKNDEHEAVVQTLREQHEEQIQQVYAETKTKVELYKQKLSGDAEHTRRIETLQKTIQGQEQEKERALAMFETFKQAAADTESILKARHAEKVQLMAQEVQEAKVEFEARMAQMDALRDQVVLSKEAELRELRGKHEQDLGDLRHTYKSQQGNVNSTMEQLENKHRADIERLHIDIARLSSSKKQLTEDFEAKLAKAQAFYDKELEVLKQSANSSHEEQLTALREQYEKLKKDSQYAESQHSRRVDDLLHQMAIKEVDMDKVRAELEKLQNTMKNSESNSSVLNKQLRVAQDEVSKVLTRMRELEGELIASRERCEQQAQELFKKSTDIGELEATKLQHESTIQDLRSQLEKLKDRIGWLEGSKRSMEAKSQVQSDEHINQFKALQQSLEEMSIEKQKLREQYEREIISLKASTSSERQKLVEINTTKVEGLEKDHQEALKQAKRDAENKAAQIRQELEASLEEEKTKHRTESLAAQEEYEKTKTELMAKLARAEDELRRVNRLLADGEQGLGSATAEMNSLRDMSDRLKADLEQSRNELRVANNKLSTVQADYDKLKVTHDSKMTEAQQELKSRLEQLAVDLDNKWKDTLRKECQKLRREITEQKDEDRRAALAQLTLMKDEEFSAAKQGWERKMQELLEQISSLRSSLDSQEQTTSEELDRLRQAAEDENRRLAQEMLDSTEGYSHKISALEATYNEQLHQLSDQRDRDVKELESRLRAEHLDQLQATNMAHKTQVSVLKEEGQRTRQEALDELRAKHGNKLESLRTELEHKHSIEMEQINREHQQQVYTARMELDRALELTKQKEGEHAMRCAELEETIHHRETSIRSLEDEVRCLQKGVREMAHDLEEKGKDILRIRSEVNAAAKTREGELVEAHHQQLESVHADHLQQTQEMLAEFSKAQDILKDKITELQMMLEEAEDRYHNREARPEDIRLIQELESALHDREAAVQKVLDAKKYYQRELVNRETNFNKVFNAAPNVGVLNPLFKKPKKTDPPPMKFNSSPALSTRLDPLPGSPLHDGNFNQMRPLPPATKKFVR